MNIIYNLFISLFGLGITIASRFNPKAKLWIEGRKGWEEKLRKKISPGDKVIWVHCSSLGEFEQGRPVIEKMKENFPNHKIAVSFFSPSGYEVRKDYQVADAIFYLPLDSEKNMKSLIKILHPEILILVKYEYWYNLLGILAKKQTPVIVISAIIREDNLFFRNWAGWFRKRMGSISHFFVQDEDSQKLLESINIQATTVAGDTRFDRVKEILDSDNQLEFAQIFKGTSQLIVAGSTWPDDDEILTHFINSKLPQDWKLIFAPHNIDRKKIEQLTEKINLPTSVYTETPTSEMKDSRVLVVDTIGILTKIYAYADIAYVGGGFTKTGVHNTLEPAVFGIPIIFGPNYENYFEAIDLIENKGAERFKDQYDFDEKMEKLVSDETERTKRGKAAADYIRQKPNSTNLIMNYLKKSIKN